MNTWHIVLLNMFVLLGSQHQLPKRLTPQQLRQLKVTIDAKNFKGPEIAL